MGLYSAIGSAISGLNASQAGLDLVSRNIANAGTPGYTRKTQQVENAVVGGEGIGVRMLATTRNVDSFLLQQIRTQSATTERLGVYSSFLGRIDRMFGSPDSDSSIASSVTRLQTALQSMATTPDDAAARQTFLNSAANLATKLNGMTSQIQGMRLEAEQNIASSVTQANALLQSIADINTQIAQRQASNITVADLQDKRDTAVNDLSKLMDVKTIDRDDGTIAVFTGGGQLLVDKTAVRLSFDERTNIDAGSAYSADPAERTVGTITLQSGTTTVDLIASGAFRSGAIAGYIEMRDKVLPQAQAQLDELAAQLALSLSQETVAGTAAASGAATGFDIDAATLMPGNQINLAYTDTPAGTTHKVTIVKVMDPSVLPLSDTATAATGDTVIGINFNQPMANVIADLQAALPASISVSNPSGDTIRFLDDGAAGTSDVNAVSTTITPSALIDRTDGAGNPLTGIALFVDGADQKIYSGSLDNPPQITGFAGRIQVNKAIVANDTLLVAYQTSPATAAGDDTRPLALLARLTDTSRVYSPSTGIGGYAVPYTGSIDAFARRIVSFQSAQAANAESDATAQQIVSNALQDRFDSDTGVNIDDEMANLIRLQNAYAANARVITTISELFQVLLSIGR